MKIFRALLIPLLFGHGIWLAAGPARGRIDIANTGAGRVVLTPGQVSSGGRLANASWGKPEDRPCYLTAETAPLESTPGWTRFRFTFTPDRDGKLMLALKSAQFRAPGKKQQDQIWVCWDRIEITGAESKASGPTLPLAGDVPPLPPPGNGSFEQLDSSGVPAGWFMNRGVLIVADRSLAADGERFARVWHNANLGRYLNVKKGQPVTIAGCVKLAETIPAAE